MRPKPSGGCTVLARVTPRGSRNAVALTPDGSLQIWTTAAPTDGQANAAVCEIVSKTLGIAKSAVSIVKGGASRNKLLAIEGMTLEEVLSRLRAD